jgi:hypothetical protein
MARHFAAQLILGVEAVEKEGVDNFLTPNLIELCKYEICS